MVSLKVHRLFASVPAIVLASLASTGCMYQHTSTGLAPTATTNTIAVTTSASASTTTTTTTSTTTGSAPASLLGAWASTAATPALPSPSTCGNFQYQVATQTATTITGTFTATCGGGLTLAGNANGVLDSTGTRVTVTATGVGTMPGIPSCAFSLTSNGTVEDNGSTLRLPFTGTTCLGPVSGVEVLRKPQAASAPVIIDAPVPVSPTPNAHITTLRPKFTVTNATRTGPVGSVSYQLDIANDEAFTSIFATVTVAEQSNETSIDTPKDLGYSKVYYWHVRASDPTTTGAWSRTLAFQVQDAPPPPVPVPVPTVSPDAIDLRQVIVTSRSPADVATWPVTTRIAAMDFRSDGVSVEFSKKDGPGRWPDVVPPGWDGALQYTLWMVVKVNGVWYTAGGVEYWYGLDRSGGPPSQYTSNWYYTAGVWGPLATRQPAPGEMVGFFVTAGDGRAKDVRSVTERSNVVLVPFPSDGGGRYP